MSDWMSEVPSSSSSTKQKTEALSSSPTAEQTRSATGSASQGTEPQIGAITSSPTPNPTSSNSSSEPSLPISSTLDSEEFAFTPNHLPYVSRLAEILADDLQANPALRAIRDNLSEETREAISNKSFLPKTRTLRESVTNKIFGLAEWPSEDDELVLPSDQDSARNSQIRRLIIRDLNQMLPRRPLLQQFQELARKRGRSSSPAFRLYQDSLSSPWFRVCDIRRDRLQDLIRAIKTARSDDPEALAHLLRFHDSIQNSTIALLESAQAAADKGNLSSTDRESKTDLAYDALANDLNSVVAQWAKGPYDFRKQVDRILGRQAESAALLEPRIQRSLPKAYLRQSEIIWLNRAFIADALEDFGLSNEVIPSAAITEPAVLVVPKTVLADRYGSRALWIAFTGLHFVLCFAAIGGGLWFVQNNIGNKRSSPNSPSSGKLCHLDSKEIARANSKQKAREKCIKRGIWISFFVAAVVSFGAAATASYGAFRDMIRQSVVAEDPYIIAGLFISDILSVTALFFLVAAATVLLLPPSPNQLGAWEILGLAVRKQNQAHGDAAATLAEDLSYYDELAFQYARTFANLRTLLYLTTALLVSGIAASEATYTWPLAFVSGVHDPSNPLFVYYKAFSQALVTSKAIYYTVLLMVVFVPAYIAVKHLSFHLADRACRASSTANNGMEPTNTMQARVDWLTKRDLGQGLSTFHYLTQIAAILAPLLTAPFVTLFGDVFKSLAGGK